MVKPRSWLAPPAANVSGNQLEQPAAALLAGEPVLQILDRIRRIADPQELFSVEHRAAGAPPALRQQCPIRIAHMPIADGQRVTDDELVALGISRTHGRISGTARRGSGELESFGQGSKAPRLFGVQIRMLAVCGLALVHKRECPRAERCSGEFIIGEGYERHGASIAQKVRVEPASENNQRYCMRSSLTARESLSTCMAWRVNTSMPCSMHENRTNVSRERRISDARAR